MRRMSLSVVLALVLAFAAAGCAKKGEEGKKEGAPAEVKKAEVPKATEAGPEAKAEAGPPEARPAEAKPAEAKAEEKPAEPAKPAEPPPAKDAAALVDRAIAAEGGLEALRQKLGAYTVKSKGMYFGDPYQMTTAWKAPDKLVMDVGEGGMVMGYSGADCWVKFNDVVTDCPAAEKQYATEMLWSFHLMNLYPLKDEGVVLAYKGEADLDGKEADLVEVTREGAPMAVLFAFDRATGLPARMEYEGHMMGKPGKYSSRIVAYHDVEGVKVPSQSAMLFADKLTIADEVVSVTFGVADEAVFVKPAQAATGVPKVRHVRQATVVSTLHKGPYQSVGMSIGKVFGFVGANDLIPFGPPSMIYVKDPMSAKSPDEYETEVLLPIAPVPDVAKYQGEGIGVKVMPEADLVVKVEIGPFDKVPQAYAGLSAWAGQYGYDIVGPAGQTTFSDPMSTPPDQLVHELFFPVKKKDTAAAPAPVEGSAPAVAPAEGAAPAAPAGAPAEGAAPAR